MAGFGRSRYGVSPFGKADPPASSVPRPVPPVPYPAPAGVLLGSVPSSAFSGDGSLPSVLTEPPPGSITP